MKYTGNIMRGIFQYYIIIFFRSDTGKLQFTAFSSFSLIYKIIFYGRSEGRTAAQKYSPARRRLPMTPSRAAVAGISAVVTTTTTSVVTDDVELASQLPSLPQHDPYTPRKRQDPDYVPYYVTNFEYILRCVIDCTDDKDLFNSEEIGNALFVKSNNYVFLL